MADEKGLASAPQGVRIGDGIHPNNRSMSDGELDNEAAKTHGISNLDDEEQARKIADQDIHGTRKQVCR